MKNILQQIFENGLCMGCTFGFVLTLLIIMTEAVIRKLRTLISTFQ